MTQTNNLLQRLDELNAIGIALSSEHDINHLLEIILEAAKRIANADAGTLYLIDAEQQALRFEIIRTDSLGIAMGGTSGKLISFNPIPLHDEEGKPNHANVAACAALSGKTVNIRDAYTAKGYDFSGTRAFDQKTGYRSTSFLTVPMRDHEGEIIGVLQLINALDRQSGAIISFAMEDVSLTESLSSQAAIALTNRQLIKQLEDLFESFIKLINTAIDDKSPYTGGHCERVPELTMMLAEAVSRTNLGPLKDFSMSNRDRYELKIAGLLHDCGKITTPVHVVDKGNKLETLFDRIHLLDTRFEVLKRDAEIAMLTRGQTKKEKSTIRAKKIEARIRQTTKPQYQMKAISTKYRARMRQLNDDRKFLGFCNVGSEAMSEESQQRVRQIALYQWHDNEGNTCNFLSDNEVDNLNIRAGTLTSDERHIINHHIDVTIKMLEALPWPRHLKNVPEYAGGHHERMDGKGYPKGLTGEQMSVQARMMAVADIFEALTAKDRPYKKGNTINEALAIMDKFKLGGHIDPDLFDIFVLEKVYLTYAQQFLEPEKIDEVDISKISVHQVKGLDSSPAALATCTLQLST
jgi:HD-GYP domain-containing protein (c-di-GMP phosphodiesterase class II)